MTLPNVYITGIGSKLGSMEVSIEDIARRFQLTSAQLRKLQRKCGTTRLYDCSADESIEHCALEACQVALKNASLSPGDVAGIYASTGGPVTEHMLPDLPRTLAQHLGLGDIDTVGMSMGCVGGIDCMVAVRDRLIVDTLEGRSARYLVVCGDQPSVIHSAADRSTAFLFSAGMSVFVLSNEATSGYCIDKIRCVSAAGDPLSLALRNAFTTPGAKFEMHGEAVYEFAVRTALPMLPRLLDQDVIPKDAYCIMHQASLSILRQMAVQAEIDDTLMYYDGIREVGNTSGASVMFGLEDAIVKGYVHRAPRVFLGTFGVGLKVGAILLSPVGDPANVVGRSHSLA